MRAAVRRLRVASRGVQLGQAAEGVRRGEPPSRCRTGPGQLRRRRFHGGDRRHPRRPGHGLGAGRRPASAPVRPAATIDLRPVDAGTLGALPVGLRAEGNAYEVTITYLPSGTRSSGSRRPGWSASCPRPSTTLLFSADGATGDDRRQAGRGRQGLHRPAHRARLLPGGRGRAPPAVRVLGWRAAVALLAVAAVVPLALGGLLLGRRRSSRARSATTRPAAPGKGQGKGRPARRTRPAKPRAGGSEAAGPGRRPQASPKGRSRGTKGR